MTFFPLNILRSLSVFGKFLSIRARNFHATLVFIVRLYGGLKYVMLRDLDLFCFRGCSGIQKVLVRFDKRMMALTLFLYVNEKLL